MEHLNIDYQEWTANAVNEIDDIIFHSGTTYHELGVRMGYPESSAKKSAWQFLKTTIDPRLSMILRACDALGISFTEIIEHTRPDPFSIKEHK